MDVDVDVEVGESHWRNWVFEMGHQSRTTRDNSETIKPIKNKSYRHLLNINKYLLYRYLIILILL